MKRLLVAIAVFLFGVQSGAFAQTWPAKPIRVIVPFSPGGAVDVVARVVMEQVSKELGQPIVVDNRVGAGGTIGAAAVAKADPDGYTILVHSSSHTVAPALFAKLPYDAVGDFSAVIPLGSQPTALFVPAARGYATVKDFVTAAKAGKMSYGSGGVGNATHLNAERFQLSAGFKAEHVPFKGSPEALREVAAGRIDFSFSTLSPALPLVKEGRVQVLAVSSRQRASALPDVPTTLEAGYPDSDYNFWIGVLVPRGTSREIIERLSKESAKALQIPQVQERLRALGADPMPMSSAEFDKLIVDEVAVNRALVKAAGIPMN
jgi:tripartite-type tricarboxylate transporter receptor subunit TctC